MGIIERTAESDERMRERNERTAERSNERRRGSGKIGSVIFLDMIGSIKKMSPKFLDGNFYKNFFGSFRDNEKRFRLSPP